MPSKNVISEPDRNLTILDPRPLFYSRPMWRRFVVPALLCHPRVRCFTQVQKVTTVTTIEMTMMVTTIMVMTILVTAGAGNEIDAHDCVIRMNVAPVKEYESDVGRRTTIR
jgi:hypothetical protein